MTINKASIQELTVDMVHSSESFLPFETSLSADIKNM